MNTKKIKIMNDLIYWLEWQKSGYGHYKISTEYNDEKISAITSDMTLIDIVKDEDISDTEKLGAKKALVNIILEANKIDLLI